MNVAFSFILRDARGRYTSSANAAATPGSSTVQIVGKSEVLPYADAIKLIGDLKADREIAVSPIEAQP